MQKLSINKQTATHAIKIWKFAIKNGVRLAILNILIWTLFFLLHGLHDEPITPVEYVTGRVLDVLWAIIGIAAALGAVLIIDIGADAIKSMTTPTNPEEMRETLDAILSDDDAPEGLKKIAKDILDNINKNS